MTEERIAELEKLEQVAVKVIRYMGTDAMTELQRAGEMADSVRDALRRGDNEGAAEIYYKYMDRVIEQAMDAVRTFDEYTRPFKYQGTPATKKAARIFEDEIHRREYALMEEVNAIARAL